MEAEAEAASSVAGRCVSLPLLLPMLLLSLLPLLLLSLLPVAVASAGDEAARLAADNRLVSYDPKQQGLCTFHCPS
jgi:hypothetical protein